MFDVLGELNWLAIIAATVVYYALGGFWFGSAAFGKQWETALGFEKPKDWKLTPVFYIGPLIGCLLASIATSILIYALDIQSLADAMMLGLIAGVGYAAAVSGTNAITPTAARPVVLGMIQSIYHIIGMVIIAVIIFSLK